MKRAAAVLVLVGMMTPSPAMAETVARSMGELGRRVKPGQKVQVLERSGLVYEGVITGLDESALTVFAGENRTIAADDLLRVERNGDSVRNGIVIGTVVGGVLGALIMFDSKGQTDEELAAGGCNRDCTSPKMVVIGAAEGALLGWLFDAMRKGTTTVYEGPLPRQGRATVGVAPIVGEGRRGVSFAVEF